MDKTGGKFFIKLAKWLTPTINDKKLTNSNSSVTLWIERKHDFELKPLKNYKKCLVFPMAKTLLKDTTNHSLK